MRLHTAKTVLGLHAKSSTALIRPNSINATGIIPCRHFTLLSPVRTSETRPQCFFAQQSAAYASKTRPAFQASPFDPKSGKKATKRRGQIIPRKAAVQLTDKARQFFRLLLEKPPRPNVVGIMLNYDQSATGEPRMVFSFDFVTGDQIDAQDEGVSLEILEDGSPKTPAETLNDGLPKLYVSHNAFLKVLGATLDVDVEAIKPILYDREGNVMDPNA
jgi:hypothetical protein